MIPGWLYSVVAALEPGRPSWTAVLDVVRLGPDDDETELTAVQVRDVVGRLIAAGHWRDGDPAILVVFDAGYHVTRLAWLPVGLLGRLRSDRVLWLPASPRQPGTSGRPRKHGRELALSDPAACPDPQIATCTVTTRYSIAMAWAWDWVHPRLTHRAAWLGHDGPLPAAVPPEGRCLVEVGFRPAATGVRSAQLRVTFNAYQSPHLFPLDGFGSPPPGDDDRPDRADLPAGPGRRPQRRPPGDARQQWPGSDPDRPRSRSSVTSSPCAAATASRAPSSRWAGVAASTS
jgi:hypothetical protein